VRSDVTTQLKSDRDAYCTTMLDYYGLGTGFPPISASGTNIDRVTALEAAVKADIVNSVDDAFRPGLRFIPYLVLHEYEGLLFSDPPTFASGIGQPSLAPRFQAIRNSFNTPEDINDNPNTAPSKRVLTAHAGYNKVVDGVLAAKKIGLIQIRTQCPHFDAWICSLENL
jgi:hypothetical protein